MMATYNDLKTDRYYLVKESAAEAVALVYVLMETNKAVFLEYEDEMETLVWKKKSDSLEEIIEELTEDQADLYESIIYEDEEDDDFSWDEDEEDDDFLEDDDEEDDDDEDETPGGGKTRKLFK